MTRVGIDGTAGGFGADWLALREPHDALARSTGLVSRLRGTLDEARPLTVLDLGSGTGANLRWLAPRLGGRQDWRLVERDGGLLEQARLSLRDWGAGHGFRVRDEGRLQLDAKHISLSVELVRADLSPGLTEDWLHGNDLVTASALLDLVSADWCATLARAAASHRSAVLIALSVDGRIEWAPDDTQDEAAFNAINAHQRTDKGFGPALGAEAPDVLATALRKDGYTVETARADWRLGVGDTAIQHALLADWTRAAQAIRPDLAPTLRGWRDRRTSWIESGASRLTVGHTDLLALPGTG